MKKDFTRDYVTEIFRVWAATGMLTYDEMRERVYNAELAKRSFMDVETAIVQAEIATGKRTPFLLDIMAAEKTMELLEHGGKTVIVRAVKEVYCAHPTRPLRRGDITDRVRHNKLGNTPKQIYLVWGSPCSGKSSYVSTVREQGDLVIDIDNIWQCLSGCDRYIKPPQLKSNVFGVRDLLLEMVKYRRGKWINAYVIGGYPLIGERERIIKSLGAREIFINTPYDECVARLKASADKREYAEWIKYVDDWWRTANLPPPPGYRVKRTGEDC